MNAIEFSNIMTVKFYLKRACVWGVWYWVSSTCHQKCDLVQFDIRIQIKWHYRLFALYPVHLQFGIVIPRCICSLQIWRIFIFNHVYCLSVQYLKQNLAANKEASEPRVPFCKVEVTTMTWLTVMEYLCHKLPRICSTSCRKHFPVLSSFTTN